LVCYQATVQITIRYADLAVESFGDLRFDHERQRMFGRRFSFTTTRKPKDLSVNGRANPPFDFAFFELNLIDVRTIGRYPLESDGF